MLKLPIIRRVPLSNYRSNHCNDTFSGRVVVFSGVTTAPATPGGGGTLGGGGRHITEFTVF